ncbi:Rad53p [Rhizophagus irregularis DAOM 197198w]|uniref:Rad53p n=3 Tax=Rhizophagus irregularis TaxID=588596 RepID=A0A015IAA0_RHIIW|nr:Rad53p [Rhizophagus irregularis DAOM 197198w]
MSSQNDITCKKCGEIYTEINYKWCEPCQINDLKQNFTNWTSGNEKIDELIQEIQLKIKNFDDIIVEWIPYNQFNDIKEIDDDDYNIIYSAIWTDGPLKYNYDKIERKRIPNKKVALKYLVNSQNNIINEFLNEAKSYTIENDDHSNIITMYGISKNMDTEDYIIVLQDCYCVNCGKIYTDKRYKWCNPCQINNLKQNFSSWTSGDEKVDKLIQKIQLKIDKLDDTIFDWIPYNQFNSIKTIGMTLYSAIWMNGPLYYDYDKIEWKRNSNEKINLINFDNSLKITNNEFLTYKKNKQCFIEDYTIKLYGISQNPDTKNYILILQDCYCEYCGKIYTDIKYKWCNQCQINNLKQNFANWTSGNEKIDELIQEMQLKINKHNDVIIEWIPFNQFNDIKKICNDSVPLYSAIWTNGLLEYNCDKMEQERIPNKEVALKFLSNSQNNDIINELLNEIESYSVQFVKYDNIVKIYGISQNQTTKDYIIVLQNGYCKICDNMYSNIKYKWCKQCLINDLKQNFANWTSENEKIDKFIQRMQLEIDKLNDTIIEWISYNQFNNIKVLYKNDSVIIYSAIFINGPLYYNYDKMEWERKPNEKVTLICLNNSQITTDEFLNKIKTYIDEKHIRNYVSNSMKKSSFNQYTEHNIGIYENDNNNIIKVYGISQNPDSKDYIMVLQDCYCENCSKMYEITRYKWCNPCLINNLKQNFVNWTSGNEIIDELIQELQLSITKHSDIIVEWIPYNHFNNIKEIVQGEFATLYSADWMNGLLDYEYYKWKRTPNLKVTLKYLYNSQDITEEYLYGQIRSYSSIAINKEDSTYNNPRIYGISQNPNTKDYIVVLENGNHCEKCGEIYTLIYIKWCESCQISNFIMDFKNWTSGNEIIDKFIQEMQLEFEIYYDNIMVEWIPYNQFNNFKKIGESDFAMLYSAIWMNGPLEYDKSDKKEWIRMPNKKVALKYLCNSQNINNEFLNKETKLYVKSNEYDITKIYGISQNPDTKNYVIVLQDGILCDKCIKIYNDISNKWCKICQISNLKQNFANWTSGNQQIDEFIQEMQLKINNYNNIVEWIPYNQFNDINKIGKNDSAAIYSAIWNNNCDKMEQKRIHNKEVTLKYLCNSQNNDITNEFLSKIKTYFIEYDNIIELYGISQNSATKDYIMCKSCQINDLKNRFGNWTSGNKIIDELIQEEQLKIKNHDDIIVEWMPYYRFGNIKKVNKSDTTLQYSAIWMNGPLKYNGIKWERIPNKKVTLKYLCSSQNITNEILNEVNSYFIKVNNLPLNQPTDYSRILHPTKDISPKIYGISQNPITRDYFIVIKGYCKKCSDHYTDIEHKWCKPCQIKYLKNNFINWTSENKKIDELIQEMQLKIKNYDDTIVEWIPYDQFNNIRKIGKGCFSTVYSALWENGPLQYNTNYEGLERDHSIEVALKCLHDSQNISNGLLNEVKNYSINHNKILKIYGISQNPITKDYIIVLQLASEGFVNSRYIKKPWYRIEKLYILYKIIDCLEIIHNNQTVHRDLHIGNILILPSDQFSDDICIMDMGLCKEVDNISNTVYGVMPYVAPEILRGKPYTQAADIYSFGMIMYFVATRRQTFANCAHDGILALNICNGIRPEINEQEAPKCYIELMKKCWSSNPDDRPKAIEIKEEINKQIEEAIRNKKFRFLNIGSNQSTVHPKACYTSRLLNPFTKNLPK